jgi:alkanesulfonate monooxygenase SsuD/methylene tetrahydromethanopterin reductase-like flavin-dependent oxidoreductase (luciferase family)
MKASDIGVFDHVDRRADISLQQYYKDRMATVKAFDEAGFYSYHVAEHHATPLGMAPSPSVYLAAVAQHTETLRFGPLVYQLPIYHPLRLIEEIRMLDHMSGGRMEIGFGRGASPIELEMFGIPLDKSFAVYEESLKLMLAGLACEDRFTFKGEFNTLEDVPIALEPCQRPHPPIWYGMHAPESAARAAERGLNAVSLDDAPLTIQMTRAFRESWTKHQGGKPLPKMGIGRFVVVAETQAEAEAIAGRAYPVWHDSFNYLFRDRGTEPRHQRPREWGGIVGQARALAATPDRIAEWIAEDMEACEANYFVGQFVFGDMTLDETLRSIALFKDEVLPKLAGVKAA